MQRANDTTSGRTAGQSGPEATNATVPARSSRLARLPLAILLGILIIAAAWWWSRGTEIKVAIARDGNVAEVVYATGIVEPKFWAKVAALQRKRIVELCRCEGLAVRKGDVLARLDDGEERAALAEIEARLKRLKEDSERLKVLLERNATTRTAYDDKATQIREYEARATAQRDRIADLELRAPMDGIVLRRDGEVGEIAGTAVGDVLLWVGQPKPLRVVAEVNEDDIVKVRDGQKVLLRHDGLAGRSLTAQVEAITPKGDPSTKTFRVYLALPEDTQLKIGMSVEANIIVREVDGARVVPAEAVVDGHVQDVTTGRVRHVPVDVGIRGTRLVEIVKGLGDDAVVASPFRRDLKDGARVRLPAATASTSARPEAVNR